MAELAGIFLSPLLHAFFERVASGEFVDFFRGQKLDQALLEKLETALLSVNAVFEDAEEKQVANENVKNWHDKLKVAVYDAEDILDEIDTEVMRCKLDAEFLTTTSKVRKAIYNSLKVPFVKKMESKIKQVLDRLEYLVRQKDVIGLREGVQGKTSERLPTTSLFEESGICGREDDKKKIINSLFSDDVSGNKLFVIAIVGMGGLGKTTLAQLVYNDEKVKEYFDLKVWACVSDDFDVFKVTKAILKGVGSSVDSGDGETLDWLQTALKESLTRKKFLIVLDDVWNDNYINWEVLSNPFRFGAQGSRVLVTTREERVALVMQTAFTYNLKPLPEKECWSLFVRHAFRGSISDMHPELEGVGRQIVGKCKGLPLAAKTIGALLWSKVGVDDWNRILKSEVWDMPTTKIIPALRLSYTYLPSHLKRCFAYCSIFPKDYFFKKKELVLLWMAEGLLQKSMDKTMEQVGGEYLFDLVSRSLLFQQSSTLYDSDQFGMHDLVNDLARFESGQFTFRLEGGNSLQVMKKTRHLSIVGKSIPLEALYEAKGLRTFLPIGFGNGIVMRRFPHDSLPMLRFLRVLSFESNSNLTELPDSIGKIRHLRYLDLSWTGIRKLPDSICKLCNLQTLKLQSCRSLTALPRDIHKLVSLRHLELRGSAITEMPLHLGRLECLQTLDIFVVNKHCGSSIGELGNVEDIWGDLFITRLQNVKSPADALDARWLKDKKHLTSLALEWDDTTSNISESDQITVLKNLQPHTNLKSLSIHNYGGKSFPDWIAHPSFSKIVNLFLYNCKYCHILPSFGQLHSLQYLCITGFHGIARVGIEFYGSGSSMFKPFKALKVLSFEDMPDWENWLCFDSENEGEAAFPRLEELKIIKCPKLTGGLPIHLPSLARLEIVGCLQLATSLPRSPTLRELELTNFKEVLLNELPYGLQKVVLKGCDALRSLPEGMMDSNTSPLQKLEIDGCCSLMLLSDDGLPSRLETLHISNCKKLEFPVHFNYSSLKELYLKNSCDSLRGFPINLIAETDIFTIHGCENLESLIDSEQHEINSASWNIIRIENCPNLVSFLDGGLRAQKLKTFEINNCGSLTSFKMHLLFPSLESLSIRKCPMLQSVGDGDLPTNLKSLSISYCPMLQSFGEGVLPTNLKSLSISDCPMLQSFGEGGLPTNLKSVFVQDCDKLVACLTTWGLQRLSSLQVLSIRGKCEDVESFPEPDLLPMTMTSLTISGFSNMTSLDKKGLQQLTFLEKFAIRNLPRLKFMPEERLFDSVSTLIHLSISRIPFMTSLDNLGLQRLTSIHSLEIYDCPNL